MTSPIKTFKMNKQKKLIGEWTYQQTVSVCTWKTSKDIV